MGHRGPMAAHTASKDRESLSGLVERVTYRWDHPASQLFEPAVTLGDSLDQDRIGLGPGFVLVGKNEFHLHATAFEPNRDLERYVAFTLRGLGLPAFVEFACANHGLKGGTP